MQPGTRLNDYEILSALGKGGMGEVYRARDLKLKRDVAIKILPSAFSQDPDRLHRLQREAELLASLNHPNIAAIYNVDEANGARFLVLELVAGETLADRVARGRVPIAEALQVGRQICEGLEAAHERGIIHRDLKPANVIIAPDGKVKLLDFGLARIFEPDAATADLSNSPTQMSVAGVVLGTAAYMSPEQARGKNVTKATDIWAFGCVLFEMMCGRKAFDGADVTEIIAAVVKLEPDWAALPAAVPASVRRLLQRCLRKDVRRRLQDATDVRIEIEDALAFPDGPSLEKRSPRRSIALIAASIAAAVFVTAMVTSRLIPRRTDEARPATRGVIPLPAGESLVGNEADAPLALSPDGAYLVHVVRRGGSSQLYRRRMDEAEFVPIPGTEGGSMPFFSADSRWIGFSATTDRQIKRIPVSGGAAQIVCEGPNVYEASWGPDDTIVFSAVTGGGLYRVAATGGKPVALTTLQAGETHHAWPDVLPGGKSILFSIDHAERSAAGSEIVVQSLATGERRVVMNGGTRPRYASGHLLYLRDGTLMAVPFDAEHGETTGTPVAVLVDVLAGSQRVPYGVSNAGSIVYAPDREAPRLVWVDRQGTAQPLPAPSRLYQFPRLSRDGRMIAVQIARPKEDIWVYDLARETLTRLTYEGNNSWPVWTPDGRRITYTSNKGAKRNVFWRLADGSGADESLVSSEATDVPRSWTPDGRSLVFERGGENLSQGIWVLPMDGDRKPWPFHQNPFPEGWARLSPDGHWLAYVSKELSRSEVYLAPFPGPGGRLQISADGGTEPMWNPSGRELFYRSGDRMMAVDITLSADPRAGKPRLLFESSKYVRVSTTPNYDVALDGQHFLMVQDSASAAPQLNVLVNWLDGTKR